MRILINLLLVVLLALAFNAVAKASFITPAETKAMIGN